MSIDGRKPVDGFVDVTGERFGRSGGRHGVFFVKPRVVLRWYSFLVAEDVGNWENPLSPILHNNPSRENLRKFGTGESKRGDAVYVGTNDL